MAIAFVRAAAGTGAEFPQSVTVSIDATGCDYFHITLGSAYDTTSVGTPTITWNGSATGIVLVQESSTGPSERSRVWTYGLVAPTSGTHDLVAIWSGGQAGDRVALCVAGYSGVDSGTPRGTPATATGSGGSPTINCSSASGELVVDSLMVGNTSANTAGLGQTERAEQTTPGQQGCAGCSDEAGASTVTMSWTVTPAEDWAQNAVSLKPSGGGGSAPGYDEPWVLPGLAVPPVEPTRLVFA